MRHFISMNSALILPIAFLTACGGGSSSSDDNTNGNTPDNPTPTEVVSEVEPVNPATVSLSFDTKVFRFNWADVDDATYYKLLENPDGQSGYSQVGNDIPQGNQSIDHSVTLYNRLNASYILQSCNTIGCTDGDEMFISGTLADAIGYFKASNPGADDDFGWSIAVSGDGNTLAVSARLEDSNATGIDGDEDNDSASNAGAVYVFAKVAGAWSQQAYVKASNAEAGDQFGGAITLSDDGNTLAVGASSEDSNATGIDGDETNNSAQSAGAAYVFTRTAGVWSQQAYVKASNTDPLDGFGFSISLSGDGDTLAIGAYTEDSNANGIGGNEADNSETNTGAVYVFTRTTGVWSQQAYVKASNTGVTDLFGSSVALNGDGTTLAVGAYNEASAATGINGNENSDAAPGAGAAYVFTRTAGVWSQQAYVKASNTYEYDYFGYTVSISDDGNTLAVGAPTEDSNTTGINGNETDDSANNAGAVYVFTRTAGVWSQQAYVKASNTMASDAFGQSISLSDDSNTLVVGAPTEDSNAIGINGDDTSDATSGAGAAYLFTRAAGVWSQQAYVKASNTEAADYFGRSISISGDAKTLAVSTNGEDSNATGVGGNQADNSVNNAGAVYMY